MTGASCCGACMEIRGERTWCDACTAPEVWPENVPAVELFLSALPAYDAARPGRLVDGFQRAEVLALMELRGVPVTDRAELWEQVEELEAEFRQIRATRANRER